MNPLIFALSLPAGPEGASPAKAVPAEEIRLSTSEFRAWLQRHGLTEILEQHLREFPPMGSAAALLALREVKRTEFADTKQSSDQRLAAAAEANRILEQLSNQEPTDPRRFEWRFALVHSLLYDEGEPFAAVLLFRGEGQALRQRLRTLSGRALSHIRTLTDALAEQLGQIDSLSVAEFEKLERTGFIEELEKLAPRAEYLALWAHFYEALAREADDPIRNHHLKHVATVLHEKAPWLQTPHAASRIQVQALLLAGMAQRRLGDTRLAREFLERALSAAEQVDDKPERKRVDWAVRLAWIELVRTEADAGKTEAALAALKRFQAAFEHDSEEMKGAPLLAALAERYVSRSRATAAERDGQADVAARRFEEAWQPLLRYARRGDSYRDELYAALFELLDPVADPQRLDPIERNAVIAGLMAAAAPPANDQDALLARTVEWGQRFAAEMSASTCALAPELVPELLYNTSVLEYRRGRRFESARGFIRVAKEHPRFSQAPRAAVLAAELAEQLYGEPTTTKRSEITALYREALHLVVTHYGSVEQAEHFGLQYARLLDELGEFDRAAAQYALVAPRHSLYLESLYSRLRCMGLGLRAQTLAHPEDALEIRRRLNDFLTAYLEFSAAAQRALGQPDGADQRSRISGLRANAAIALAEVQVLVPIDRPSHALETLKNWEADFPNEVESLGRVWSIRLTAYEQLGKLQEFLSVIPSYLKADLTGAGPVLQAVYKDLHTKIVRLRDADDADAARAKADMALAIAEQLHARTVNPEAHAPEGVLRAMTLQLAEAYLFAGQFERASQAFLQGAPELADAAKSQGVEPGIQFGFAEAMFGLKDYHQALPWFNRLATRLPPSQRIRWEALLRDLQCRTALGEPAAGIIKTIEQQRYLAPELGGSPTSQRLLQLLHENERRAGR